MSKDQKKTKEQFIELCNEKHKPGNYDYTLTDYRGMAYHIKIFCNLHNKEFEIKAGEHKLGHGCRDCANENRSSKQSKGKEFFEKCDTTKFDYSKSVYLNSRTKITIRCIEHDYTFEQDPYEHSKGHITCKECQVKSHGEERVDKYLKSQNIEFVREKRFDDCRYKNTLPFDFWIESKNTLIEFDGRQHFPLTHTRYRSDDIIEKDKIKTDYCLNNGIKLIRISYLDISETENILKNNL